MIETLGTVMGLAATPWGLFAVATTATVMALVRRGGQGRRRTD